MRAQAGKLIKVLFGLTLVVFVIAQSSDASLELPFEYDKAIYAEVSSQNKGKITSRSEAVETAWPIDLPAHTCFYLEDKRQFLAFEKGPRYFSPAYSTICFIPATDASENDFDAAYPNFTLALKRLRTLIKEKPAILEQYKNLTDIPYNNSGWSVIAKTEYLEYDGVSGVSFLTQYTNELWPNPLNNEELTFNFQGLTKDGKYYVAARFAITNPKLPKGIDFTDKNIMAAALAAKTGELINKEVEKYLSREERKLEGFEESSFRPTIGSLRTLISTIGKKK